MTRPTEITDTTHSHTMVPGAAPAIAESRRAQGRYAHVIELVRNRPWAVLPSVLSTIGQLVAMHVVGERFSRDEIDAALASAAAANGPRAGGRQGQAVAIIPLYGTIIPRANLFSDMSGGTSVQGFLGMFRQAIADPEIGGIVIDVDSPGGLIDLITEASAELRAARGQKPTVAVANTLMASAAYWLGCSFDEVAASPSALVGSIGVYHVHDDISEAMAQAGVKRTLVSAGKFKTEGNPFEPLSDEARAHLQALTDDAYSMFTGDVAKARGAKIGDVRNGYGQGRVLTARQALDAGMIDRIATLDDEVRRMVKLVSRPGGASGRASYAVATSPTEWAEQVGAGIATAMSGGTSAEIEVPVPEPDPLPDPPLEAEFAFDDERYRRQRHPPTA